MTDFKNRIREDFILIEDLIKMAYDDFEKDKINDMLENLNKAKNRIKTLMNVFINA